MSSRFYQRVKERLTRKYGKRDEPEDINKDIGGIYKMLYTANFLLPVLIAGAAVLGITAVISFSNQPTGNPGNSGLETRTNNAVVVPAQQDTNRLDSLR